MAQSLDQFTAEMKSNIDRFEQNYRKRMAEYPDRYPATLPDDNEGLWMEFFITFCETGEA